jgi:two-component system cell cycle response regulator
MAMALATARGERPSVLIIDDGRVEREELARMLDGLGYAPICAESPFEGVRMVQELRPDLVLLDVVMPTWDGYKVVSLIKSQASFTPVILLTSLNDLDSKRRGQAAGADDFLSKPVTPLELQIRMSALLRIKALTDELATANRRLAELAQTDPLTGLHNRRMFDSSYAEECGRSLRYGRPLGVLALDLDHFKSINDRYGHGGGDDVLRAVARSLSTACVRRADRVARIGGEEFAIIAVETDRNGLLTLAERLRKAISELSIRTGEHTLQVTVSIGAAAWTQGCDTEPGHLLEQADAALYAAKRSGRDRVVAQPLPPATSTVAR